MYHSSYANEPTSILINTVNPWVARGHMQHPSFLAPQNIVFGVGLPVAPPRRHGGLHNFPTRPAAILALIADNTSRDSTNHWPNDLNYLKSWTSSRKPLKSLAASRNAKSCIRKELVLAAKEDKAVQYGTGTGSFSAGSFDCHWQEEPVGQPPVLWHKTRFCLGLLDSCTVSTLLVEQGGQCREQEAILCSSHPG